MAQYVSCKSWHASYHIQGCDHEVCAVEHDVIDLTVDDDSPNIDRGTPETKDEC